MKNDFLIVNHAKMMDLYYFLFLKSTGAAIAFYTEMEIKKKVHKICPPSIRKLCIRREAKPKIGILLI
jgi:hypothetical protein